MSATPVWRTEGDGLAHAIVGPGYITHCGQVLGALAWSASHLIPRCVQCAVATAPVVAEEAPEPPPVKRTPQRRLPAPGTRSALVLQALGESWLSGAELSALLGWPRRITHSYLQHLQQRSLVEHRAEAQWACTRPTDVLDAYGPLPEEDEQADDAPAPAEERSSIEELAEASAMEGKSTQGDHDGRAAPPAIEPAGGRNGHPLAGVSSVSTCYMPPEAARLRLRRGP